MSKWIAEFELEDGDTMPKHMDLNYMGAKIEFHCRPLKQEPKIDIDKIKEEINRQKKWLEVAGYNAYNVDIAFDSIKSTLVKMIKVNECIYK